MHIAVDGDVCHTPDRRHGLLGLDETEVGEVQTRGAGILELRRPLRDLCHMAG